MRFLPSRDDRTALSQHPRRQAFLAAGRSHLCRRHRRIEDLGVTGFWVVPWVVYGAQAEVALAEGAVPTMFNAQPSLQVKADAIKRYGDEIISKFQ